MEGNTISKIMFGLAVEVDEIWYGISQVGCDFEDHCGFGLLLPDPLNNLCSMCSLASKAGPTPAPKSSLKEKTAVATSIWRMSSPLWPSSSPSH